MDYALRADRRHTSLSGVPWALLGLPLYVYMVASWVIRPLSVGNTAIAYAVPLSFGIGLLLFQVPRAELARGLRAFRVELILTLSMSALAVLSVANSSEPFQIFRILFPSILPCLLFFQLVAFRSVSPEGISRIPRQFMIIGLGLSCLPLMLSMVSGGIRDYLFLGGHRYMGLFDHENQQSVMLAVLVPLAIVEISIAERQLKRWLWIAALLLLLYTMLRTGSKTTLFVTLSYAWLFYVFVHARFHSPLQNIFRFIGVLVVMLLVGLFGLQVAEAIDPVLVQKIERVFEDGIGNYATIQSREVLWREAWRQGTEHWLIGTGAGETILGTQHAHNLALDYFRGIGVFGGLAIILLCLRILQRAGSKAYAVMTQKVVTAAEMRILGCYVAAAVYVLCNQLSNSFGPATISALWIIYIPAILSDAFGEQSASQRAN